ncbi:MAG: efflux RND transporter periplasmic adaptor subunit [Ferruginibacter sp.]
MRRHQLMTTLGFLSLTILVLYGCSSATSENMAAPPPELPVITVASKSVTTYQEFRASLQGEKDIEIRPQVDGYLDKINVDEGACVHKGQVLFHINSESYREQLSTAEANVLSAKAAEENALINVNKLTPLVQNNVISDVQLKSAQAVYDAAKANVAQAQSSADYARTNLGYTTITAPEDGYIGMIPFKTGSLVTKSMVDALTVLSETKDIHVYFSMSEADFMQFKNQFTGNSIEEKIKQIPPVQLVLADNSIYPQTGKVELAEGQFDKTIGAINFRATFPNAAGLLRSGNTGKIRIPHQSSNEIIVPQEATYNLQDKIVVFVVSDSNTVTGKTNTSSQHKRYLLFSEWRIKRGR